MTYEEKVDKILKTFNLSKSQLANILGIELDSLNIKEKALSRFKKVFNLDESILLDDEHKLPLLELHMRIDKNKYKNIFDAYGKILREYFSKDTKVYVLTKIKNKKKLESIFDLFFRNDKKSIIDGMSTFSPSYLIETINSRLLVDFDNDTLNAYQIDPKLDPWKFVHNQFTYKIANQINLK